MSFSNYSIAGVGLQTLVNTVRNVGANNLVLFGGINWGFDLSQLGSYPHVYPYPGKNTPALWDAAFGYLTSSVPFMKGPPDTPTIHLG